MGGGCSRCCQVPIRGPIRSTVEGVRPSLKPHLSICLSSRPTNRALSVTLPSGRLQRVAGASASGSRANLDTFRSQGLVGVGGDSPHDFGHRQLGRVVLQHRTRGVAPTSSLVSSRPGSGWPAWKAEFPRFGARPFPRRMTIALGTSLGGTALYLQRDEADPREVALGAVLPALFWGCMRAAFAFPGTAGLEAEFPRYVPRIAGVWINERFLSVLMTVAACPARRAGPVPAVGAPRATHRRGRPRAAMGGTRRPYRPRPAMGPGSPPAAPRCRADRRPSGRPIP